MGIKFSHALTLTKIEPAARLAAIAIAKEKGKVTAAEIANAARTVDP